MTSPKTAQQTLQLLQIFDSQFPVGAFAHSNGLETYGQLRTFDRFALQDLLREQLNQGWGNLDMAAVCLAFRAQGDATLLSELNDLVAASKVIPGLYKTSLNLGKRTVKLARRLYDVPELTLEPPHQTPHQTIALGWLGYALDLNETNLLLAFAHSTILGSLMAATRAMALSPEQAQEVLLELQPDMANAVNRVQTDPERYLWSCTPALDMRAHQQAFLHTRLFQS